MVHLAKVRFATVIAAALLSFSGCKKQVSTLTEPATEPTPIEKTVEKSTPIDTSDNVSFKEVDLDEQMQKLAAENMKTLFFAYNSFDIGSFEKDQLAIAAKFLQQYPNLRILVEGHCDERGASEYNMGLGENRARATKSYLVNLGISSSRLEITSWGKERPVNAGCMDDNCHKQNRRATFVVISK